ncbi:hypothetical protein LDVICp111 [lymphocystis disease virus-China]|uniref:Uncharacterized protein n=2 Tax=Lymphocystis disease virus 2 TaxID=159183 RepID=A0A6F8X156_9VIRU|nr:hypothetical protein LDVICp111 [lymphocystis disease virus-China]AAU10956.1 hypothetical protein [lymphocystis disease virus-China]BCB67475.1 hypothetical protein [Lymphocystis disease virus 2]
MNCAFCEQSYWFICQLCIDHYNSTPEGRDILRLTIYMFLKDALIRLNAVINTSHRLNLTNLSHVESYKYQKFIRGAEGLWTVLEPIAADHATTITIPFAHWTADLSVVTSDLCKLRKMILICLQNNPHLLVTSTNITNHVMDHCVGAIRCFDSFIYPSILPQYNIFKDTHKLGFESVISTFSEESKHCQWQETIGPIKIPLEPAQI